MKIEHWRLDRLTPYANNPRQNDAAVENVAESIRQFGFKQPIVVDADGVIIVGHTRYKAAVKLGWKEVPVHVAKDLSPEQAKAYRIADNRAAEMSDWDFELLPIELGELKALDVDLGLIGFGEEELAKLLDPGVQEGQCDPDEVPEPPDEPVTRRGDLWILGNHRLLCGDAGSVEDLDRLLDGQPIHLVNTDPPYNVRLEPRSNNAIAAGNSSFRAQPHVKRSGEKVSSEKRKMRAKDRPLENDFVTDEQFERLLNAWFGNISRVLLPGRAAYIWGGYSNLDGYPVALRRNNLYWSQCICWRKCHPVLSRKDYMGDFELAFYSWREGAAHKFFGPNNVSDVWEVKKVNPNKMIHLTEKPVELAVRAIQYSSQPGENVLDLFGGSGSTLIGCEQTGRRAFVMELDPAYCDVITQRFEQFSGQKAERVAVESAPTEA